MSRRKLQWKRAVRQSGDVNKLIPTDTKGSGEWLKNAPTEGRSWPVPNNTKGSTVTKTISPRKEQLVRQWAK